MCVHASYECKVIRCICDEQTECVNHQLSHRQFLNAMRYSKELDGEREKGGGKMSR